MRTTREVTRQDLVAARKIYSTLTTAEKKKTNSRELAQAIVNIKWLMDTTQAAFEATGKY